MSSEHGASATRIRFRLDAAVAVLVLVLLLSLVFLFRSPPRTVPVFDLLHPSVSFVGVRPDAGDRVYDAGGKNWREEAYEGFNLGPWPTNMLRRDFIFDLEANGWTNTSFVFSYYLGGFHTGNHPAQVYHLPDGRRRLVMEMQILRSHHQRRFIFKSKPAPTRTVDISLNIVEGPRLKQIAHCRGVRVDYPELPYRVRAESVDRLEARLEASRGEGHQGQAALQPPGETRLVPSGVPGGWPLSRNQPFQTPREALDTLEVVRGPFISMAWQMIDSPPAGAGPGLDLRTLDAADQAKVRQNAWAWTQSANEEIRRLGVTLGLKGHWPEFVEPALDLLNVPTSAARNGAINALMLAPDALSSESIARMEERLQPVESMAGLGSYVKLLDRTGQRAAREVLLRLATHPHPRVWRQTLLALDSGTRLELARQSALVRERHFWMTGEAVSMTKEEQAAAWRKLTEQLTPELKALDLGTYTLLYSRWREKQEAAR